MILPVRETPFSLCYMNEAYITGALSQAQGFTYMRRDVKHKGNSETIPTLYGINSCFAYLCYSCCSPQLTVAATMILPHPDR